MEAKLSGSNNKKNQQIILEDFPVSLWDFQCSPVDFSINFVGEDDLGLQFNDRLEIYYYTEQIQTATLSVRSVDPHLVRWALGSKQT